MRSVRRTEVRRTDPRPLHHRTVERYLIADEKVVVATRRHWSQQLPWFAAVVAGFFLVLSISYSLPDREAGKADFLWWPWFALLAWFGWKMLNWSVEWFVCTNKRLVLTYGVITHKVAMLPMRKVTDMSYHRTPLGQMLGYGTFVMESAGQVQAMSVVQWVPRPDDTYLKICGVLFGDAPKPPASGPPAPEDPMLDEDDVPLPGEEDPTHVRPLQITGPRRRRTGDTVPDVLALEDPTQDLPDAAEADARGWAQRASAGPARDEGTEDDAAASRDTDREDTAPEETAAEAQPADDGWPDAGSGWLVLEDEGDSWGVSREDSAQYQRVGSPRAPEDTDREPDDEASGRGARHRNA